MSCNKHDLAPDTCASCHFSRTARDPAGVFLKGQIECHRYPATMDFIPVPKQGLGGLQLDIQMLTGYPVRPEGDWCGEYKHAE